MLGGSASMDNHMYLRGSPIDYNTWANITRNTSWRYENILKYFIKAEHLNDAEIQRLYPNYHGLRGPTNTARNPFGETADNYLGSFAEIGSPRVLDLTANVSVGYTEPLYASAELRQTPALTYISPISDNKNLFVSKNTRVTEIVFRGNTAVGVKVVYDCKNYYLRAKKEIIISAGVFNTPQLLMLSGIGPKKHLTEKKIKVKADLPVGNNLRDHVAVNIVHKLKQYKPLPYPRLQGIFLVPRTVPIPVFIGSVPLDKAQPYPDYQTYIAVLEHDTHYLTLTCKTFFAYRDDICDRWERQVKSRDSMVTTLAHMQPKSRGIVRLRSTDSFDKPLITTGYYSNKEDLEDMLKYVKDFIRVGDTTFFKSVGAELAGLDIPDCAQEEIGSDDYWRCYIKTLSASPYHFSGTCAMGSVVDDDLKLIGFEKIRIVDASVMPTIPRGRTTAIVIMIAEKAAEMILNGA